MYKVEMQFLHFVHKAMERASPVTFFSSVRMSLVSLSQSLTSFLSRFFTMFWGDRHGVYGS